MSTYFADPDGDALTYSVDVGDHLTAVLDGAVVTLMPETDWLGTSDVQFHATDGKGGDVSSPLIRVDVVAADVTGDTDYVPYIIVGSIILLIVVSLVFGAFAKKFQQPPEH